MLIDGFLYLLAFAIRVRRGDVFSARRSIHVIIPGELAGRRHFNACGVRKSGISCHFSDFAVVRLEILGVDHAFALHFSGMASRRANADRCFFDMLWICERIPPI